MTYSAINEMRSQVLLNPTGTNIEQLIKEIEISGSAVLKRDITFLRILVPPAHQSRPKPKSSSILASSREFYPPHRRPPNTEVPSWHNATKSKATLKVPASAQWSFINGLGDMEWIQGACVRQCLEDRLLHAQALPSPERFGVSISGWLQREPVLLICTPFHSISFQTELEETAAMGEWRTYRYRCSADHNEAGDEGKAILYEMTFGVTAGDYFRELAYTF